MCSLMVFISTVYMFLHVCLYQYTLYRIAIGAKLGGEFNSIPKNGNEVLERFQKLLKSQVGSTLCEMYAKYWKPSEMARYLEEAALYARNHKSTISMADSVSVCFLIYCT